MDWLRAIPDGFMMSVYFNLATALWWLHDPMAFADDYPKPIKKLIKMPEKVMKGKKLELPGTEGNIYYSDKYWMRSLGIPEHWLEWPLIICPMFAAASAGIGLLIRIIFA